MASSEFQIISDYFTHAGVRRSDVALGIGDDAALLRVPTGQCLVVSIDTLVEGVHFLPDIAPRDLGYRALAVNLSDLAAMGAEPAWATLALTLPRVDDEWLAEFSAGFFELAQQYQVQLVGGNTTRGPLSISVQIHGLVPELQALRRDAAQIGDLIFVTGTLGEASVGLQLALKKISLPTPLAHAATQRWLRPTARIGVGLQLRGVAHACIDISDGLLADLGHICVASGVGARVHVEDLPLSELVRATASAWNTALSGGDDYELCFTVPAHFRARVDEIFSGQNCAAACIGSIEAEPGVHCWMNDGSEFIPLQRGYDHFAVLFTP